MKMYAQYKALYMNIHKSLFIIAPKLKSSDSKQNCGLHWDATQQ